MPTTVLPKTVRTCKTHAAPASRASWYGQLCVASLCVPVKALAAIAKPPENPLRQLHAECGQRIEYQKWCPKHGAVPPEKIVKGYPFRADQYIELSEGELAQLRPSDDKSIHLKHFVKPSLVDPVLFAGRSLYLVPANPAAVRPFELVRQAIARSSKWGIGLAVLSNRRHIVIVRPREGALLMHTLHHPSQCRALATGDTTDVKVALSELRPLLRVINGANGDVNWDDYLDNAERRLTALVEAKIAAAQRPRTSHSARKRGTGNDRSSSKPKSSAPKKSSGRKRKAA